MKAKLLVVVSIIFSTIAFGQSVKTLEYDMAKGKFTGLLPFDQPFNLKLTNIAKDKDHLPDSIAVRLIEVPKKNYDKIAAAKRKDPNKNGHAVTAEDVYSYNRKGFNYTQDRFYFFMLDTMLLGQNFNDTFYSLSVPFYLKPESKYFIEIRGFTKRELADAEQNELIDFIPKNHLYQQTINNLVRPNILNPNLSFAPLSGQLINLQNVVQQVVKAKHRNYVINQLNYTEQLQLLSTFLIQLNNISAEFDFMDTLVSRSQNNLAAISLPKVRQSNIVLTNELMNINWMRIQSNDAEYRNFFSHLDAALTVDKLLLDRSNQTLVDDTRNNVAQAFNNAIDLKNAFNAYMTNFISSNTNSQSVIASTNQESLVEQAKLHVAFDLGYAYVGQIDRGNAYAALHIYFRSIDTSLPLKNYKLKFWDFIGARTSFLIGTSIQSIQKDSVRKGIINNDMAIVTGLGFRLLPWFRINGGAYLYYLYDKNPLRTKKDYSFKASPFVSVSIDFNLSSFLGTFGNGNLFNSIFKK